MPAEAGIQGRGWIPAFAGMTDASCQVIAQILTADVFSQETQRALSHAFD